MEQLIEVITETSIVLVHLFYTIRYLTGIDQLHQPIRISLPWLRDSSHLR